MSGGSSQIEGDGQMVRPVVVITGAAGALGSATSRVFQEAGYRLVQIDRVAACLGGSCGDVIVETAELSDRGAIGAIRDRALAAFGRIDALCNVAGGFAMGDPVHRLDMTVWQNLMAGNVESILTTASVFVPSLIDARGSVVNVAALGGLRGRAGMSAYGVAKSAVMRLTESMAEELACEGVRVNAVLPGTIDTPANRAAMPAADRSLWVEPEAIAEVMLFLCSSRARAISGALLPVGR